MTHEEHHSFAQRNVTSRNDLQTSTSSLSDSICPSQPSPAVTVETDEPQHAQDTTATMSEHGPHEERIYRSSWNVSGEWIVQNEDEIQKTDNLQRISAVIEVTTTSRTTQTVYDEHSGTTKTVKRARISFCDFAVQARLQRYQEKRETYLRNRRRILEKSTALAARLCRTVSWIKDGLAEIAKHDNKEAFAQVYEEAHRVVNDCISGWDTNIQRIDTLGSSATETISNISTSFHSSLTPAGQTDLVELIRSLRSDPHFIVQRLRLLTASQASTLNKFPKFDGGSDAGTVFSRQGLQEKLRRGRLDRYVREVRQYASSLERTSPLSFLLFNLYGADLSICSSESRLRLETWAVVCAELKEYGAPSYQILFPSIMSAFATMHGWPAKKRLELFLTDFLQKGAFLLGDSLSNTSTLRYDPFSTETAKDFLNKAMTSLLRLLIESEGGFPMGSLALAQAICAKLSTDKHRTDFRGHFFIEWYFNYFLYTAVMSPENEGMLLKVHISYPARSKLLFRLIEDVRRKVEDVMADPDAFEDEFSAILLHMICSIDGNPHTESQISQRSSARPEHTDDSNVSSATIVVCASEIVRILESLSPQGMYGDPVMNTMHDVFKGQYSFMRRFDTLKSELVRNADPGTSVQIQDQAYETWAEFSVSTNNEVEFKTLKDKSSDKPLKYVAWKHDSVQKAAIRLCSGQTSLYDMTDVEIEETLSAQDKIVRLFQQRVNRARSAANPQDVIYWETALSLLRQKYHMASMGIDDTEILLQPMRDVKAACVAQAEQNRRIEESFSHLEHLYQQRKKLVEGFITTLEQLRLKFWYSNRLVNIPSYIDAKYITSAMSHMNIALLQTKISSGREPSKLFSSASSNASFISTPSRQTDEDTTGILKAPAEHGGPRKLADVHIASTNRWLQANHIENFCKGEERIHRFCMEIQTLAQKIVTANSVESEELWSDVLFRHERSLYYYSGFSTNSAPASTRAASIMSDSASASFSLQQSALRTTDTDARSTLSDDRNYFRRGSIFSTFSRRLNPSLLPSELASSISSHRHGSSARFSGSDIFSHATQSVTAASSATTASIYSQPALTHHDLTFEGGVPSNTLPHSVSSGKDKIKFLTSLKQELICLLLSDLGCLIWSHGSETDSWLTRVQSDATISVQLQRRMDTQSLTLDTHSEPPRLELKRARMPRRHSSAIVKATPDSTSETSSNQPNIAHVNAMAVILEKLGQCIDPQDKLTVVDEFCQLNLEILQKENASTNTKISSPTLAATGRKLSLDTQLRLSNLDDATLTENDYSLLQDTQLESVLKKHIAFLKPITLYRDLQYISAFVPASTLSETARGKSFLQLGVAALAYKSDLCQCMVESVHRDEPVINRTGAPQMLYNTPSARTMKYWQIAAAEGNAVAQRELALAYLASSDKVPVYSMPMSLSADVFKDETMWHKETTTNTNTNRQALCLALHWMRLARDNNDPIARQRLEDRKDNFSIR